MASTPSTSNLGGMKWIDHATDVARQVEEKRKTDPGYSEPVAEGVNWRSENYCWRVTVVNDQIPKDRWTWSVYDMRGMQQPWGPLEKAQTPPVLLVTDLPTIRSALIAAEVASLGKIPRMLLGSFTVARQAFFQTRALWNREQTL